MHHPGPVGSGPGRHRGPLGAEPHRVLPGVEHQHRASVAVGQFAGRPGRGGTHLGSERTTVGQGRHRIGARKTPGGVGLQVAGFHPGRAQGEVPGPLGQGQRGLGGHRGASTLDLARGPAGLRPPSRPWPSRPARQARRSGRRRARSRPRSRRGPAPPSDPPTGARRPPGWLAGRRPPDHAASRRWSRPWPSGERPSGPRHRERCASRCSDTDALAGPARRRPDRGRPSDHAGPRGA